MLEREELNNLKSQFSADHPIRTSKEDLLGRQAFAESLATAIYNWNGSESLAVSLYGEWGSGKSSVKNMVIEAWDLLPDTQKPTCIEFNAWQYSGQEGLLDAFFQETGKALGIQDKSREGQKLAAKWKSFAGLFRVVRSASESIKTLIEMAIYIIPPITLGSLTGSYVAFTLSLITFAGIAKASVSISDWIGSKSEDIAEWISAKVEAQRKTLDEKKQELSELLKNRAAPLVIILDDIDRLTALEIQLIFRLVKANLDLPNVAYLLLFQRASVEKALRRISSVSGRDYLEKIVQAGFDIPAVEQLRLEKVLFSGLNDLIAHSAVQSTFDRARWENIFLPGLRPYFGSLRNVYRFLSTLKFHVGVFKLNDSFEVNIVDLIALEVLRMFEPDVYYELRKFKGELTGIAHLYKTEGLEKEENDHVRQTVEAFIKCTRPGYEPSVREILKQLFPPIEWVFGGPQYGRDFADTWYQERRICSSNIFDRYFILGIPHGDVSHFELQQLLGTTNNRKRSFQPYAHSQSKNVWRHFSVV